jgi:glycosyltransferase involved in cell wall biosynthesis
MNKVIFITGSTVPETGGELYNLKVIKYFEEQGIDYIHIPLNRYRGLTKLSWLPFLGDILVSLFLVVALLPYKGIYVEDHYFSRYLLIVNFIQRVIRKSPVITIMHLFAMYESDDKFRVRRWLASHIEKVHLAFSNSIVATSDYSSREIQSLGFSDKDIEVIYPGVDRDKFSRILAKENDCNSKKILCVANYIPRKGGMTLIEAYSKINSQGFVLHMVGNPTKDQAFYQQLTSKAKELHVDNSIIFHDGKDQEVVKYLYSNSDIFVLPSFKETFGIVLIEAMHYGLPIITNNCTAMPDLISDGENGILVTPGDIEELAQALETLITQPELRKKLGKQGQEKVKKAFCWNSTCSDFLTLVRRFDPENVTNTDLQTAAISSKPLDHL